MNYFDSLKNGDKMRVILDYFKERSKNLARDVLEAYRLARELHDENDPILSAHIDQIYRMVHFMEPEAEDAVALFLYYDYGAEHLTTRRFMECFSEKRYEGYRTRVEEALQGIPLGEIPQNAPLIRHRIFRSVCDKMFLSLLRYLNREAVPDAHQVNFAYRLIRAAHKIDDCDDFGIPLLVHLLRMARFLAELGLDSNVIATAILYDIEAQAPGSIGQVEAECGKLIADNVRALSELQRRCGTGRAKTEGRAQEELCADIAASHSLTTALYVHAAHRIEALRMTRKEAEDQKQIDYLPYLRRFRMNAFLLATEDLLWRTQDLERYTAFEQNYKELLLRRRPETDKLCRLLRETVLGTNPQNGLAKEYGCKAEVKPRLFTPLQLYRALQELHKDGAVTPPMLWQKQIPLCDMEIILDRVDPSSTVEAFLSAFLKRITEKLSFTGSAITDCYTHAAHCYTVTVEDEFQNAFCCRISSRSDHSFSLVGHGGGIVHREPEEVLPKSEREKIRVRLQDGKTISLPKGVVVLDVAFAIHEALGYSVKGATINGHRASLYEQVPDHAQVILEADCEKIHGVFTVQTYHVRINWLSYVVTAKAKKMIIRLLSQRYEGEADPFETQNASDAQVGDASDAVLAGLQLPTDPDTGKKEDGVC